MTLHNAESDLVKDAARGDAEAFSELYHLHRDRVFNFANRMIGVRSVAEDVTHEAFLVLIEHPERFQPERGSLLTFLCTIARYHIIHYLRHRESKLEDDLNNGTNPHRQIERDPLDSVLDHELVEAIEIAIATLAPLQREVIVLREFQQLTYQEIARVTGTDVNVVKVRLHRARQSLRQQLAAYLTPDEERCHELH